MEGEQVQRRRETAGIGTALVAGLLGAGTLGYRYTEWIIEAGKPVYVLGTALAGGRVGKSAEKKQWFVISIKSEEEREKSLTRTRLWLMIGAAACIAGAPLRSSSDRSRRARPSALAPVEGYLAPTSRRMPSQ